MHKTIGYRIRKARENKGLDQIKLSAKLDISVRTLQRWEKGEQVPDSNYLIRLANCTGVRAEWLLTGEGSMYMNFQPLLNKHRHRGDFASDTIDLISVPLFSTIPAGRSAALFHQEHTDRFVIVDNVNDSDAFALIVKGDSMAPKIEDGDIVIISPRLEVRSGDICVVRVNEEDVLKKVKIEDNYIHLIPLNPAFEPLTIRKKDVRCIWKVVKVIKSL